MRSDSKGVWDFFFSVTRQTVLFLKGYVGRILLISLFGPILKMFSCNFLLVFHLTAAAIGPFVTSFHHLSKSQQSSGGLQSPSALISLCNINCANIRIFQVKLICIGFPVSVLTLVLHLF